MSMVLCLPKMSTIGKPKKLDTACPTMKKLSGSAISSCLSQTRFHSVVIVYREPSKVYSVQLEQISVMSAATSLAQVYGGVADKSVTKTGITFKIIAE